MTRFHKEGAIESVGAWLERAINVGKVGPTHEARQLR
jgi:hypothetical protein